MAIPLLPSGMTPPVDYVSRVLFGSTTYMDPGVGKYADKGIYNLGISYCRKIAGSSSWSNHAFGNALDIGIKPDDSPVGDEIAAWLKGPFNEWMKAEHPGYSIAHVLWKVASHHNHIHVDFNPYGTGTPPCAGGPKGAVVSPWPVNEGDDDMTADQAASLARVEAFIVGVDTHLGALEPGAKGSRLDAGKALALKLNAIDTKLDTLLARP